MNIAIIGCGLIGEKRLLACDVNHDHLLVCCDSDPGRAKKLQELWRTKSKKSLNYDTLVTSSVQEALDYPGVELAVVATTNQHLAEITIEALRRNIHVLVEKPASRNLKELLQVEAALLHSSASVKIGFNHRFHPAILKAKEIVDRGELGKIMFIRGRYGHGGRLGMEKEWRSNPTISGGGELLDQGCHMIDLSRWFLGNEFQKISGKVGTFYWPMEVDDNAFMTLETHEKQLAWLHVSCSEWKNIFSMEIYGRDGKLMIDGLGGSYGMERLTYYKMLPEMGPPDTTIYEYPRGDNSWREELKHFKDYLQKSCIERAKVNSEGMLLGGVTDAISAMRVIDQLYKDNGYDYH
ncbi:MAG: Gfo/Idh/MocA family oxidoreductase [Oligoflexia bacterium]|nr:Gfo/Idh/MocA family oxidoreductase [Oligoflexia bacterium]MBF0366301.1 Gfo/Idh/MocA family oxidoreductase [Oligoflexia bacterium]